MAVKSICLFNKFGHCKFGDICRLEHLRSICGNSACNINTCEKRHPRECKYWNEYKRCRFGDYCSFKHKSKDVCNPKETNVENELATLKAKIEELEIIINEKEEFEKKVKEKVEHFKSIEARVEKVEETIRSFVNDTHATLDNNVLEKVNESICTAVASALVPFAAAQEVLEKSTESKFGMLQDQLGSLMSLLKHPKTLHKEGPISFPCELCGQDFDHEKGLQKHVRTNHKPRSR